MGWKRLGTCWLILSSLAICGAAPSSGFVSGADAVRLYYEMHGEGEPLLVLAGGPGDSHFYFKPYFKKLEKAFTVVYLDGRGRGRSSGPSDAALLNVDKDAEDAEAVRAFLGFASLNVFGHSYGGIVAQRYALNYPARVRSLVLCSTFHGAGGWQENIDECNRAIRESYPEVWSQLEAMGLKDRSKLPAWRALYDPAIQSLYWYHPSKRSRYLKELSAVRTEADSFAWHVYYSIIGNDPDVEVGGSMKGLDLREELKNLNLPVLILAGRGDRIATVRQASEIRSHIPAARLHVFEHSGHLPFVEENRAFTRIVKDFILREARVPD